MQKVLNRRLFRDIKQNFFRYIALFLLVVLGMYLVISIVGAAESVIGSVSKAAKINKVEDGQFSVFVPLENDEITELISLGISLEPQFYLDYMLVDESTVRIYKNREQINLINLEEGYLAEGEAEIVLEKHYAQKHKLSIGSNIIIGGISFTVTGLGTSPDYDLVKKNLSDSTAESTRFGTGFVSKDQYDKLKETGGYLKSEEYVYSFLLNDKMMSDELKQKLGETELNQSEVTDAYFIEMLQEIENTKLLMQKVVSMLPEGGERSSIEEFMEESINIDIDNLTHFVIKADNPRIGASVNDVMINKYSGIVAGVIIMVLFTYVISVFIIHGIERDNRVIGALYALGAAKRHLIRHYLTLPVLITLLGGIIGLLLGLSPLGIGLQSAETTSYCSLPPLQVEYPIYLLLYGIVMPPFIALMVNYLVINKKLSQPALAMLRNEQKQNRISNVSLGKLKFVLRFQIRQFLREIRASFTVIIGMFIALLILMMGIDCYALCSNIKINNKADVTYEYMYTYKYPTTKVPEEGEASYAEGLKKDTNGYNLDVSLLGIDEENPYFDFQVSKGKNKVTISDAVASKFQLSVGEKLILTDEVNDRDYSFTITHIVPYSIGLYAFMNLDDMRDLFDQEENYYNVAFATKELDIDSGRLYVVTTKEDIHKASDVFVEQMTPLMVTLIGASIVIFIIVLYLMLKVMVERSAYPISLMKIYGYRQKEIKKLYLDGNTILIAIFVAICIPPAKLIMNALYPYFVANAACGINLTISWWLYLVIYAGMMFCYLLINRVLTGKIKKIVPAEVLKNRE